MFSSAKINPKEPRGTILLWLRAGVAGYTRRRIENGLAISCETDDRVGKPHQQWTGNEPRPTRPWVVAHRGANREAPENTRAALDRALQCPLDGIEFDVQLTRDGVPVLYHDRTLARIDGGRKRIADHTYKALEKKDWGGWFSNEFAGEKILSLEQALERYAGRIRLLIEIKSRTRDRLSGRSGELTRCVLNLLTKHIPHDSREQVFILSFDPGVLDLAHGEDPDWRYVLNLSRANTACPDFVWARCTAIRRLTSSFVVQAHRMQQRVMTYACNIPAQVRKALELEVDVIMSDRPAWLAERLQRGIDAS